MGFNILFDFNKIFVEYHKPADYEEELLVQSIIDLEWRCRQIAATEQGLLAIGRIELADTTPGHLLPAAAYLKYKREIKDLSLQEHRLHRYREADLKKLQALQSVRKEAEMLRRKMEEARAKQQQQPPQPQAVAASAPASQPIHRTTVEPLR